MATGANYLSELIRSLARNTKARFGPRKFPIQPTPQPTVELARRFAFDSLAIAEELAATFKLSFSGRRAFEYPDEVQQLR